MSAAGSVRATRCIVKPPSTIVGAAPGAHTCRLAARPVRAPKPATCHGGVPSAKSSYAPATPPPPFFFAFFTMRASSSHDAESGGASSPAPSPAPSRPPRRAPCRPRLRIAAAAAADAVGEDDGDAARERPRSRLTARRAPTAAARPSSSSAAAVSWQITPTGSGTRVSRQICCADLGAALSPRGREPEREYGPDSRHFGQGAEALQVLAQVLAQAGS